MGKLPLVEFNEVIIVLIDLLGGEVIFIFAEFFVAVSVHDLNFDDLAGSGI